MTCPYQQNDQKLQEICSQNRMIATTMLSVFRDSEAIVQLEPLLERYDIITEQHEGCPLLLAELINNLALAYSREQREDDYARLQERVEREASYFARHGLIKH